LLRDSYDQRPSDADELVTTNEQLNGALARNDSEYEIFQKMDEAEENVLLSSFLPTIFLLSFHRNGKLSRRKEVSDHLA
jgi:hypothetical protein